MRNFTLGSLRKLIVNIPEDENAYLSPTTFSSLKKEHFEDENNYLNLTYVGTNFPEETVAEETPHSKRVSVESSEGLSRTNRLKGTSLD